MGAGSEEALRAFTLAQNRRVFDFFGGNGEICERAVYALRFILCFSCLCFAGTKPRATSASCKYLLLPSASPLCSFQSLCNLGLKLKDEAIHRSPLR
jgi:hypothetical protein